jgi:hypothetical protein
VKLVASVEIERDVPVTSGTAFPVWQSADSDARSRTRIDETVGGAVGLDAPALTPGGRDRIRSLGHGIDIAAAA